MGGRGPVGRRGGTAGAAGPGAPKLPFSSATRLTFRVELRDIAELRLPRGDQLVDGHRLDFGQMTLKRLAQHAGRGRLVSVRTFAGFLEDLVDASELGYLRSGDAHGFGRELFLVCVAPHDGGAGLGRDDKVERVFKDEDTVADG